MGSLAWIDVPILVEYLLDVLRLHKLDYFYCGWLRSFKLQVFRPTNRLCFVALVLAEVRSVHLIPDHVRLRPHPGLGTLYLDLVG